MNKKQYDFFYTEEPKPGSEVGESKYIRINADNIFDAVEKFKMLYQQPAKPGNPFFEINSILEVV